LYNTLVHGRGTILITGRPGRIPWGCHGPRVPGWAAGPALVVLGLPVPMLRTPQGHISRKGSPLGGFVRASSRHRTWSPGTAPLRGSGSPGGPRPCTISSSTGGAQSLSRGGLAGSPGAGTAPGSPAGQRARPWSCSAFPSQASEGPNGSFPVRGPPWWFCTAQFPAPDVVPGNGSTKAIGVSRASPSLYNILVHGRGTIPITGRPGRIPCGCHGPGFPGWATGPALVVLGLPVPGLRTPQGLISRKGSPLVVLYGPLPGTGRGPRERLH
jgi:hypothetical protein